MCCRGRKGLALLSPGGQSWEFMEVGWLLWGLGCSGRGCAEALNLGKWELFSDMSGLIFLE